MKVAEIQRGKRRPNKNCNLYIDGIMISLSGPQFGHIAEGNLLNLQTTYNSSEHDLRLIVMVRRGMSRPYSYIEEEWYVRFR